MADKELWERRRRNLRALIATKQTNATQIATDAKLSKNTLRKFLSGETISMKWDTLEKVCKALDIRTPMVLDADNPFAESKEQLYKMVFDMSDEEAKKLLEELSAGILSS